MTNNLGILDLTPIPSNRMDVRVADATVVDLDGNVFWTKSATLKPHEPMRAGRRISGHTFHGVRAVSNGNSIYCVSCIRSL